MCFHEQRGVPNRLDAIVRLPAGIVSKGFQVQLLAENKGVNPGLLAWHRHWNDPFQVVNTNDTEQIREQRARVWFNQFVDGTFYQYADKIDFISWWNEYYANSQSVQEKELWWRQERAAARIWWNEYRSKPELAHIRLTICAAAVGNNIPVQSAQTSVSYDAPLDYHGYDKWLNGQRESGSWEWYAGRWTKMDDTFKAAGIYPFWLFGEGGPYSDPVTGWRGSSVCGGDIVKYVDAVQWWIERCKSTRAYQTGRVIGPPTLFTSGGSGFMAMVPESVKKVGPILPEGGITYRPPYFGRDALANNVSWTLFETGQPEMNIIADRVKQVWGGISPPPPPPPPPPPDPDPPPPDPVPAVFRSFENGWEKITDRLQRPNDFELYVIPVGQPLWYPGGDVGKATGTVEAKHLKCLEQLPPHECKDGSKPLILDGVYCYKMQGVTMAAGTSLKTVFSGSGRKRITVPVNVHWQNDVPRETDDVILTLLLNGIEVDRLQVPELKDRTWMELSGEEDGPVLAELRYQKSYRDSRDCFTDFWTAEDAGPDPCKPRVDYSRYYVVIHDSASIEQAVAVMRKYWPARRTIGGSLDDAGHGPGLTSRTALLLGFPSNEHQILRDWYGQFYPGTVVQFAPLPAVASVRNL